MSRIERRRLAGALSEVAETFGGSMREYILRKTFGKHLYELEAILRYLPAHGKVVDVGGGLGVNLMVLGRVDPTLELHLVDKLEEYEGPNAIENPMGGTDIGIDLQHKFGIRLSRHDFWAAWGLPFDDGVFDVVTCFDVIEHAAEHPVPLLRDIRRILKPDGTFVMCAPNLLSTARRGRLLLGRHPYMHFDLWMCEKYDRYYGHFREYTRREYHVLLERSGFSQIASHMVSEPTRTKAFMAYHHHQHSRLSLLALGLWLVYLIEIVAPSLRTEVYCVARS